MFAAHFRSDIHFMTWHALVQGFKNLSKEEQESILKMDSLKMILEKGKFRKQRWLPHVSNFKFVYIISSA